jgi:hypothetical protein
MRKGKFSDLAINRNLMIFGGLENPPSTFDIKKDAFQQTAIKNEFYRILDIVDFQMCYIDYIIRDLKYLENLKILRLNNCDFLKNDVLPENLEILIIDDICNCSHWTEVLENLEKGIIKYENIIKLKNVPIFVKRIILNFNYYFVEILEKK